ncbi:MAG: hypothetical protein K5770_17100 [Lachnospiraceae bacterium]|nr:hypothetical protein [Lachnospiraceae bacterium]
MNSSKKKFEIKKGIWLVVAVVAAFACTAVFFMNDVFAVFSEKSAMKYKEYASTHEIEDSMLFIGTYLIHISAVTDELYSQAEQSGSDSNQTSIYYKSELANGAWFDITNAGGLTDIMDSGIAVSDDEIGELYVQYYVDSSGTMTDVMSGEAVNPFDVPDPYNLKNLPELESLWVQYAGSTDVDEISIEDYLKSKNSENTGNTRADVYTYQLLTTFFSLDLSDDETDKYDADLERLFACYQSLKSSGQSEEADIVYSLMSKVDQSRRAIVMQKLAVDQVNVLGVLRDLTGGAYYTTFGDFKDSSSDDESEAPDSTDGYEVEEQDPDYIIELKDAVSHEFTNSSKSGSYVFSSKNSDEGEWWEPLQDTYDKFEGKAEEAEKDEDKNDPTPRPSFSADSTLTDAIMDGSQSCQTSHSNYLAGALSDNDSILGHAEYEYSKQVIEEADASGAGGPIIYLRDLNNIKQNTIKHSDSEKNLLDTMLLGLAEDKYQEELGKGAGAEYTAALSSGAGASSADNALDTQMAQLESRRSELEFFIDAYKQRETAPKALTYVQGAISWTEGLYGSVKGDAFSSRANGSIDSHLKWLKDMSGQIKDSDDSLKTKLDELNDKKEELQRKRDAALDDNDLAGAKDYDAQIAAVDQDIAEEEAKTGEKSGDALADSILSDALADLANDPQADISGALSALAGMGAVDALSKIKDRAQDAGASEAMLNNIDDSLKDGVNTMASGDGSTSDSVGASAVNALNSIKDQAESDGSMGAVIEAADYAINKLSGAAGAGAGGDAAGAGAGAGGDAAAAMDAAGAIGEAKAAAEQAGASDDIKGQLDAAAQKALSGAANSEVADDLTKAKEQAQSEGADAAVIDALDKAIDKIGTAEPNTADKLNMVGTVKDRADKAGASDALKKKIDDTLAKTANGASASEILDDLKKIKDMAQSEGGGGVSDELMKTIDNALSDMKQKAAAASGEPGSAMNEAQITEALEAAFGKPLAELSESDVAVATVSVSRLARSGNSAAGRISANLADYMRSMNNKYLYGQYRDKTPKYISLKTIGLCTPYRYLYDDRKNTATMSQGASAYIFTTGSVNLERNSGDSETLSNAVVKAADPMISEDDAKNYFGVDAEYIYGSSYAVCLTDTMEAQAKELSGNFEN